MRFEQSISIAAAPQLPWDVLTDAEHSPEWTSTMTSVKRLDDGPFGIGSEVRIEQPRLPTATWTVTECDPPTYFAWESTRPGVRSVAGHRIEPSGEGCVVTLSIEQAGPLAPLAGLLYGRLIRRYLETEATSLKARCQSHARR